MRLSACLLAYLACIAPVDAYTVSSTGNARAGGPRIRRLAPLGVGRGIEGKAAGVDIKVDVTGAAALTQAHIAAAHHHQANGHVDAAAVTPRTVAEPKSENKPAVTSTAAAAADPSAGKVRYMTLHGFLMGVSDVICYKRYGSFATMMTGNTIQSAIALGEWNLSRAARIACVITSYLAGTVAFKVMDVKMKRREKGRAEKYGREVNGKPSSTAVLFGSLGIALLTIADVLGYKAKTSAAALALHLPVLSFAFGILNCAAGDAFGSITYAMTGHIGKVGSGIADRLLHRVEGKGKMGPTGKTRPSAGILGGFAAGIVVTAAVIKALGGRYADVLAHGPIFTVLSIPYAVVLLMFSKPTLRKLTKADLERIVEKSTSKARRVKNKLSAAARRTQRAP